MQDLLLYLEQHYISLFLLILIVFVLIWMINWLAWIFGWGRFKKDRAISSRDAKHSQAGGLYLLGQFIVNIINDFRHLLALVFVLIFGVALGYVFIVSSTVEDFIDALQAVMATLGTLVGSIVGYYFGESAVKRANEEKQESKLNQPIIQQGDLEGISDAPPPPNV